MAASLDGNKLDELKAIVWGQQIKHDIFARYSQGA